MEDSNTAGGEEKLLPLRWLCYNKRYIPPASTRSTPFISSSKSRALIRLTGILVSTTNVLICNPSGLLFNSPTTFSSSSLKSGNSSRCRGVDDVFLYLHSIPWFLQNLWLIRLGQPDCFLSVGCIRRRIHHLSVRERRNNPDDNFRHAGCNQCASFVGRLNNNSGIAHPCHDAVSPDKVLSVGVCPTHKLS